jgi:hypothetical protein
MPPQIAQAGGVRSPSRPTSRTHSGTCGFRGVGSPFRNQATDSVDDAGVIAHFDSASTGKTDGEALSLLENRRAMLIAAWMAAGELAVLMRS